MKQTLRFALCAALLLMTSVGWSADRTKVPLTEAELIRQLGTHDEDQVNVAISQLRDRFPTSTNAIHAICGLLKDDWFRRRAARALGDCHAELELSDVKLILGMFRVYSPDEVMDGLKAIRGLKEPDAIKKKMVADVLPLLQDTNTHVVRDACRTLAVIGNKDTISYIEPLLKSKEADIRLDAKQAIDKLQSKG